MTTTIQQAIYEARVRGKEQLDQLAQKLGVVSTAEEKVTASTSNTERSFQRLVGRLDPAIRANQQYQTTLEKLQRYERAGVGTAQERAIALELAARRYGAIGVAASGSAEGVKHANNQFGMSRQLMYQMVDVAQGIPLAFYSPAYALQNLGFQVAQIGQLYYGQGGMSAALRDMRDMAGSAAAKVISFLNPFTLLTAGLAAGAAAAYAINRAYENYAIKLDDVAHSAGVATDELAKLQHVAAFNGIPQGEFFGDIGKFAANVYRARDGMGDLGKLLGANNMHARDFGDAMNKVADLIMRARDDQQRLQLLQQAGLPATMEYVRLLKQGADGLAAQKAEVNSLGTSFDRNMIEKAHEAQRNWNQFWENFKVGALGAMQSAKDGYADLNRYLSGLLQKSLPFGLGETNLSTAKSSIAAGLGSRLTVNEASRFYDVTGAGRGKGVVDPRLDQQLRQLQAQLPVLQAITGQDRMVAQYEADINALLQEGKTLRDAQAIASAKLANSQAEVDAGYERQIRVIEQQIELQKARENGTYAEVAAAQAYKNAMDDGASSVVAAQYAAAVLAENIQHAATNAVHFKTAMQSASRYDPTNGVGVATDTWSPGGGGTLITGANYSPWVLSQIELLRKKAQEADTTPAPYYGFADGGVMTPEGPMPLMKFADGGITTRPSMFMTSENYQAEGIVPLKNGAIPARVSFGSDFATKIGEAIKGAIGTSTGTGQKSRGDVNVNGPITFLTPPPTDSRSRAQIGRAVKEVFSRVA